MQDFLHRLYSLAQNHQKLPREDFVSRCLGRQLEVDRALLDHLVSAIAKEAPAAEAEPLKAWLAMPEQARSVEVRAQVLARTAKEACPGWADLILTLRGSGEPARVVIEAKVGQAAPSAEQLNRYREAFSGACVVGLVEQPQLAHTPGTAISWDDVLLGLRDTTAPNHLHHRRLDLQKLLVKAEVGDARLALTANDYTRARTLEDTFHRLDARIRACLIQMGANDTLRAHIQKRLSQDKYEDEPDEGWGAGFVQKRAIPGTRLRGLTLGVRASSFADELVWQLEVCVSGKKLPRWMNTRDSEWNRVAGTDDWFVTELSRPRGTGHLTIDHFRDLIEAGRGALRRLHLHTKAGKWHAYGEGAPPHAPRLKIPELRAGLQIWEPVSDSIDRIVTDTLRGVCAPHDERERPFRAREGGWRTFEGAIPHGRRLFGERVDGIGAIAFTWTPPPESSADTLQQALQAWPSELPVPEFTPDHSLRIPLQADTFNHPRLVPELVRVLSALSTH